ncbi:hypothetical protein [Pseudoalteromonas luteoviolacea]|uniref:Uncharacterized protein n=1 Tax=Pseudoalteromonas luteoviolacea NCIMB 1942 TaxID=1365253 RepID=A0A162A3F4_9GAMM|nr:hypothetical protein [Pseudoalteromonas luteoviolacea]KZN43550.1 hypothetical protein N482_19095 [Pseudoalteromonas luteoviolacea NCIMB 1942]
MKKYFINVACILGLLSSGVYGADVSSGVYSIDAIRVSDETGITYVDPEGSVNIKNLSCTSSDTLAIDRNAASYAQIYSALLAAAASSRTVEVWVSIDANDCLNGRQRISVIQVNF